jgi:hypothetical protein
MRTLVAYREDFIFNSEEEDGSSIKIYSQWLAIFQVTQITDLEPSSVHLPVIHKQLRGKPMVNSTRVGRQGVV